MKQDIRTLENKMDKILELLEKQNEVLAKLQEPVKAPVKVENKNNSEVC